MAAKIIKRENIKSIKEFDQLQSEVYIMSCLNHPRLVKCVRAEAKETLYVFENGSEKSPLWATPQQKPRNFTPKQPV